VEVYFDKKAELQKLLHTQMQLSFPSKAFLPTRGSGKADRRT
jgi:hypothetical protein